MTGLTRAETEGCDLQRFTHHKSPGDASTTASKGTLIVIRDDEAGLGNWSSRETNQLDSAGDEG